MKKIAIICFTVLMGNIIFAQADFNTYASQETSTENIKRSCGTISPTIEWELQFQKLIEQYVKDHSELTNGKVYANYTIPVIFHIIHGGQAIRTYPNLAPEQVYSQIQVLNADYAGIGYNVNTYPSNAFVNYAVSLPSANKDSLGRVKIANTGIQFCLATKDPNGNTLSEPGIDRIDYTTKGWTNPASFTDQFSFMTYINSTIKPQSIWDPTRYFNVWVTDENSSVGLLGFATFPAGTGLPGLSGTGTSTTDGVWIWAKACGSNLLYPSGNYISPYNKGRTLSHEAGHWLGLRHIWGDGTCATDYCNDTPPAQADNSGCPSYPFHVGTCSGNSPDGEMFMNFMDYTDDACMYMFTVDQNTRMQTAMTNGTYRKDLTTSASTLCASYSSASACFSLDSTTVCTGTQINLNNCSLGSPPPNYTWTAVPPGGVVFTPNKYVINPTVKFTNAGTYTLNLIVTNDNNMTSSTYTTVITAISCPTGIENFSQISNNIIISPNPSDGLFVITTNFDSKQNLKFEITNLLGQIVYQGEYQNVLNDKLKLNISMLENGIYFFKLTNGSEKVVKRIIINK
ncbi:MAG TPA: M43 family zinc metalloprotease [Bacteroidia bacterium]|nr:M43 family zinc metalloprotease [Bacteroidia bacterium]